MTHAPFVHGWNQTGTGSDSCWQDFVQWYCMELTSWGLYRYLRDHARTIAGKSQLFINAFAKALEVIPRQLCDNAGLDATDILNRLRQQHASKDPQAHNFGVDVNSGAFAAVFVVLVPTSVRGFQLSKEMLRDARHPSCIQRALQYVLLMHTCLYSFCQKMSANCVLCFLLSSVFGAVVLLLAPCCAALGDVKRCCGHRLPSRT